MADDTSSLEDIFGKEEKQTQAQPSEETQEQKNKDEQHKKEEQLANLNKAIAEANQTLKSLRGQIKKPANEDDEEEIPKIDDNDPGSKAWNKRIKDNVSPLQAELEKEKQEVFNLSLKNWLSDKPQLVSNPESLKKVVETYERLKNNSGRVQEAILQDLDRAFAAEFHEDLFAAAGQKSAAQAKAEAAFAEPAVSRGSTSYPSQKSKRIPQVSDEDRELILKAYPSLEKWWEETQKYGG